MTTRRIYSSTEMIRELDRIQEEMERKAQREFTRIDTTKAIAKILKKVKV